MSFASVDMVPVIERSATGRSGRSWVRVQGPSRSDHIRPSPTRAYPGGYLPESLTWGEKMFI